MGLQHLFRKLGSYQVMVLAFFCLSGLTGSFNNYAILLNAPTQQHWCTDPSPSFQNLSREQQRYLMPETCRKPDLDFDSMTTEALMDINISDIKNWTKCQHFEYSHDIFQWTLTEKFDLVCDRKWWAQQGPTVYMIGYFFAGFSSGLLCDRFGRKTLVVAASFGGMVLNVASMFPPNMVYYYVIRWLLAVMDTYIWIPSLVLIVELTPTGYRNVVKLIDSMMFDVLSMLIGVLAFIYAHFQFLHGFNAFLYLLTLLGFYFFVGESPRWLTVKQRHEDAQELVRYIAEFNKTSEESLQYLVRVPELSEEGSVLALFRTPVLRRRFLLQVPLYFLTVMVTYSIIYNLDSLSPDLRLGFIISGALSIPSLIPCMLAINKVGRQITLFVLFIIVGLCSLVMIPLESGTVVLFLFTLGGKFAVSGALCIIFLYSQELFPTCVRTTGMGTCSTLGRFGALLAIQLIALNDIWQQTSVVGMATGAILAAILIPSLPDTTGVDLPQSISEGEALYTNHVYKLMYPARSRTRTPETVSADSTEADKQTIIIDV